MALPAAQPPGSPEAYLTAEREATHRHEYVDGEVYAMSGASLPHITISTNIAVCLGSQLRGGPCRLAFHDLKVRSADMRSWFYPDFAVVCGQPVFHDELQDVLLNPVAVIEVLSPSTERYDRGAKFERYREIESLQAYVLVAQDRPVVETFHRDGTGVWTFVAASGLDAVAELTPVSAKLRLAEVYEGVEFPERPVIPHPGHEQSDQ